MSQTETKAILYRCFSVLFASGIHVNDCLSALAEQTESLPMQDSLLTIQAQVLRGSSLSISFARQSEFSKFEVECLAAGEKTGSLHDTLNSLADHFEQSSRLQNILRQQLIYPVFVCVLAILAVVALPGLLQRSLQPLFEQAGAEMPWLSLILTKAVAWLGHPASWLAIVAGIVWLIIAWKKSPPARRESLARRVPVVGSLAVAWVRLTFLKTLHLTVRSGMPVLQGLQAAGSATGSDWANKAVARARLALEGGESLSAALSGELVPGWLAGFLRAGEEAGSLEALLRIAARVQEEDLLNRLEQSLSLIQPVVVTLMGGMVALLALGVLLPITKVLETL